MQKQTKSILYLCVLLIIVNTQNFDAYVARFNKVYADEN